MSGGDLVAGNVSIDGIVTVKQDLLERETINTLAEFSAPAELYEALIQRVKKYHPSDDISLIEKAFSIADEAHKIKNLSLYTHKPSFCLTHKQRKLDPYQPGLQLNNSFFH